MKSSARLTAGRAWCTDRWTRSLGGRGYSRFRELDLDTHVLAFSAQQVLCTAPLLVAISSILDRFTGRDVSFVVSRFFGLGRESSDAVGRLFSHASRQLSLSELVFGLIVAVLFATSVATVQQRALELIWSMPRIVSIRSYVRQLAYVPALALFIAGLLFAGRLGRALNDHLEHGGFLLVMFVQGALVFVFYWWTQHWLLRGRVSWRDLVPGALAVAVATVVAVRLSRLIMDGQISWQVEAYGLVGAVFVLSVWLGIFSAVIFAGVLAGAVWVEHRELTKLGPLGVAEGPVATVAAETVDPVEATPRR